MGLLRAVKHVQECVDMRTGMDPPGVLHPKARGINKQLESIEISENMIEIKIGATFGVRFIVISYKIHQYDHL